MEQTQIQANIMVTGATRFTNWLLLAFLLLFVLLYNPILLDLFSKWFAQDLSGTYSHGLLVAVIVLYLIYKSTSSHQEFFSFQPNITGFILLLCAQLGLFAALLAEISFVQHILFVCSLLSIVWAAYSYKMVKLYILPAVLFFMTFPVWGDLAQYLQQVSIFSTNLLLSLTGLPYYREQAFFHFPVGIIEIAPECAGLQQLLVSIIIGLLFSYQHNLRLSDTVKTLIYISIVSILVNTIRIIIIMAVGYFTKMESSLISQHILLGWIIYGIGIFLFLLIYSRKKFKSHEMDTARVPNVNMSALPTGKAFFGLSFLLMVIIMPSAVVHAYKYQINQRPLPAVKLELGDSTWVKSGQTWNIDWLPNYPPADISTRDIVSGENSQVYIYALTYSRLKAAVKPLNMVNTAYQPKVWRLINQSKLNLPASNGAQQQAKLDYLISKRGERLAVLSYYRVNGHVVDSLFKAKSEILSGLLRLHYRVDVVFLVTRFIPDDNDKARQRLTDVYRQLRFD